MNTIIPVLSPFPIIWKRQNQRPRLIAIALRLLQIMSRPLTSLPNSLSVHIQHERNRDEHNKQESQGRASPAYP